MGFSGLSEVQAAGVSVHRRCSALLLDREDFIAHYTRLERGRKKMTEAEAEQAFVNAVNDPSVYKEKHAAGEWEVVVPKAKEIITDR